MVKRGELWWVRLPAPPGSEAGHRRPAIVVQADWLNRSALHTAVLVPLTSNTDRAQAAGNVLLPAAVTGLPKASVATVALVTAVDQSLLETRIGELAPELMKRISDGLSKVLGL